mmetsp:Transcript_63552/g.151911  ORF Transcript_63552/g.151911 Transcript_63552/m.151911 type:complete len:236 (-) Transcript_63552:354-1061(-)
MHPTKARGRRLGHFARAQEQILLHLDGVSNGMPCLVFLHKGNQRVVLQVHKQLAVALQRSVLELCKGQTPQMIKALHLGPVSALQILGVQAPGLFRVGLGLEDEAVLAHRQGALQTGRWQGVSAGAARAGAGTGAGAGASCTGAPFCGACVKEQLHVERDTAGAGVVDGDAARDGGVGSAQNVQAGGRQSQAGIVHQRCGGSLRRNTPRTCCESQQMARARMDCCLGNWHIHRQR